VLTEPAEALTDLLLGLVVCALAIGVRHHPGIHRYWQATFWWAGAAALAGFVHHGFLVRWPAVADVSWPVISVMVVVAASYLLAATVEEVLGPGHTRTFWLLRTAGLLAYVVLAATGHAGVAALLACESITFACVLGLWGRAAYHRDPLAVPVLVAIAASGAAAGARALSPAVTAALHLDPTSLYHLAQIIGMVLLYRAVTRGARRVRPQVTAASAAAVSGRRPARRPRP
jgi:hypothetical protein